MPSWKFDNLEDAKKLVSGERMDSSKIGSDPVGLKLAPNLSFDLAGAKLTLNPAGNLSVAVLNDEQDIDADTVIARDDADTPGGALAPHFRLKDGPWLKLRAEGGLKAKLAADLSALIGISAGVDAGVVIADYRKQARTDKARDAFVAAVAGPRFITAVDDVRGMGPGDVLVLRRGGSIVAGVSVNAADLFTGQIGTLGRVLGSRGPIAVAFDAGATLEFEVTVSDEFLIVISRDRTVWRAGVRKANGTRVSASLEAGITARLKDPKAVQTLIQEAIDAAIGRSLPQVQAILGKATLEDLNPAEKKLFDEVAKRLGVGGVINTLGDLRTRIDDLTQKAGDKIKEIVQTRVSLSFAYEYSRVQTHVNLLQVTLTDKALARFHPDLVAGRTLSVLEAIQASQPGVTLESYLNQKEIQRDASWGFTLGIGKWLTVGGKDFRNVTEVERTNAAGEVQRSYLGTRGYKGTWVGETFQWMVDLRADMKGFAKPVKVSSYSFGLHLVWASTQKSLSASELEQWVDIAQLWKVVPEDGAMELRAALAALLKKDASISVQITVPTTVLRSVLPMLAAARPEQFAPALAAAMPWRGDHEGRRDPRKRRALYTPLWERALQDIALSSSEWAHLASDHLEEAGEGTLAFFERTNTQSDSFASLIALNGNTREICQRFTTGARALQSNITNDEEDKRSIPAAFKLMDDLWTQSHHVRAVGVRILDMATDTGQLQDITRTLLVQGASLGKDLVVTA